MDKLVDQDSKSPDIDFVVVLFFIGHLRGHVLVRSAESGSLLVDVFSGPSEVADLDVLIIIEQ